MRRPRLDARTAVRTARALDPGDAARRVLWTGRVFIGLVTVALVILLGRVAQLQRTPDPRVVERLERQQSNASLLARRGAILDRRGRPLAHTRVTHRLFVDPALIADHGTFSQEAAARLGPAADPLLIDQAIAERPGSRYVVIDTAIPDAHVAAAERAASALPGLAVERRLTREHPQGTAAAQVIGFTDHEGIGREGLEATLNAHLLGSRGNRPVLRDARRRPLWPVGEGYTPQRDGDSARLTLDLNLQRLAERLLAETVAKFNAESAQLVALDPVTGDILVLANVPLFDPEQPRTRDGADRWRNRCVTDAFEPGSVMKPMVWAAAIQLGYAAPDELFDTTTRGWWKPTRGPVLRDAHPHGELSWDGVLIVSSNIGMALVAERMGRPQLHGILEDFGFGRSTGSGLPGEIAGLLRPLKSWSWTDLTRLPMGQGIAVTPLQMTHAFGAIAADGLLVPPRIRLDDADAARPKIPTRILTTDIARHTRQILRRVVTEGTGRKAQDDRYQLFGKTGTAQLPDLENGGYLENGYVSSFIAGAPLETPRLVVGCFVHKPDKSIAHYGGVVAAPIVRDFMTQALHYLGVEPDLHPPAPPPALARGE